MTVRWKPLLVLSGLFVITGVMGLTAIFYAMVPRGSADLLPLARNDRQAKKYDNAVVQYRRALQKDGKDAAIHMEMADMYAEWEPQAPAEKRAELHALRLRSLAEAAKYGKALAEPRRRLLADALRQDEAAEAAHWAEELLALEPNQPDAHYVMADRALADGQADLAEARKHLEALKAEAPPRFRTDWVRARLAREARDDQELAKILERARRASLPEDADPIDRMALLRLRAFDAETTNDPAALSDRADAIRREATALVEVKGAPAARITQVSDLLDRVQSALTRAAARVDASGTDAPTRARLASVAESIDEALEAAFRKANDPVQVGDLRIARAHAAHLLARGRAADCRQVVDQALKSPLAALPAFLPEAMDLREVAVRAVLADAKDESRFDKAAPYIQNFLNNPSPRYQGLGHLFQGAIDLERSGLVGGAGTSVVDPKRRASALGHLREAASQWTNSATAQALYGVALILTQEPALGRQYLQNARRLGGGLEARYQIWAAWSVAEAGYPEDAEPIVNALTDQVARGELPRELAGTLHLLSGEIAQARGGPENLEKAHREYRAAYATGQAVPAAVGLRLAQLEVMRGDPGAALARIDRLRAQGKAGAAGERLAVLTLLDLANKASVRPDAKGSPRVGDPEKEDRGVSALMRASGLDPGNDRDRQAFARDQVAEAHRLLDAAVKRHPESHELIGLAASLLVREDKAKEADERLAAFLSANPENASALQMRAQILAEKLHRSDEARKLLNQAAERAENTAPLVQLAMLDLAEDKLDAASRSASKIRGRWKEAAAADLLDAQIAAKRGNPRGASQALEAALRKDPTNKVALFWKAQLDDRAGSFGEAAKVYEEIARRNPSREITDGLSLATASRWALATQAMESQNLDVAIAGYEGLLQSGEAGLLLRPARWKLVAAYASKGNRAEARKELDALLKGPETSDDERVQAANYYRMFHEDDVARRLLDGVLKDKPAHPGAVVTRSYMLTAEAKDAEAVALIERAISTSATPPPVAVYLMLAAVENHRDSRAEGRRKTLDAIDRGLKAHPEAIELIKAKYRSMRSDGDPRTAAEAVAFVESRSKADPKGPATRFLIDVYREAGLLEKAEAIADSQVKAAPKDPAPAALLIDIIAARAVEAAGAGRHDEERKHNDREAARLRQFRAAFPTELAFPEAEGELAARRGDRDRALAITREMDALDRTSTAGPLLRARIFEANGFPREAADAYREAVERNPRRADIHLALAQASLNVGKPDEAVRQAGWVLEAAPETPAAQLLKARALVAQGGTDSARQKRREEAIGLLRKAVADQPKFADARRLLAEVQWMQGRRAEALDSLRDAMRAVPGDPQALALLVQRLAEAPEKGRAPVPADLKEAQDLARGAEGDGDLGLAAALGFHRAGQVALALASGEKAADKIKAPASHQAYGDLLLSAAEVEPDPATSRDLFRKAVAQYDLVLKVQPNALEAVNNKAWILHRHLQDDKAALALAEGFLRRSNPDALPGEFYDTLGAIQESLGRSKEAEDSYARGLRKAPDLAVLNYHMGRLVSSDRARSNAALEYLRKADQAGTSLRPADREEVAHLLARIGR